MSDIKNMKYVEAKAADIPMELLLQADPSEQSIRSYLESGLIFTAIQSNAIIGVCVAGYLSAEKVELYNVSVLKEFQSKGVGTKLLEYVLKALKLKGISRVELGTGTFGYQLTYYQRLGFRVASIVKDHFINNYSEPIYENGIQLKDMLRLYANLEDVQSK